MMVLASPRLLAALLAAAMVPLVATVTAQAATNATYDVVATVTVEYDPYGVGVDPATHTAYVANYGSDTVSVIDTTTNTLTTTIGVGDPARSRWRWTRPRTPPTSPTSAPARSR